MLSRPASRLRFLLIAVALPMFAKPSVQGIDNFYQVNAHLYRGAQPSTDGFKYLANLGVKTIVDLREADSRSRLEQDTVTGLGMKYVNVPMTGLTPPTEAEIVSLLATLEDESGGPVFVHCKRGADRTGAVIAAYRIDHDHWDNGKALKEAMSSGMSMFQLPRQSYIRGFHARVLDAKSDMPDSTAAAPVTPAAATR